MNNSILAPSPRRTSAPAPRAETLRLSQFGAVLRRQSWLILLCGMLGAVGAFIYAHGLPKTYTASSAITVEGAHFAIPELEGALRENNAPDPMPWVRTEEQALTARAEVARVTAGLHLDQNPEFNPALRPPTLLGEARGAVDAVVNSLLPKSAAPTAADHGDEAVVNAVQKALAVFQDNRSLVIQIAFTSEDPALSARVVNTLVADYLASRVSQRSQANQGANQDLTQRIEEVRADLGKIEKQMSDLRSQNGMVGLRAGSVGQQQVEELTSALAKATLERSQLQLNYERAVAAQKQGSSDELAAVLNSPTISRLREQASEASARVAELSARYGSGYPGLRSASAQLGTAQHQLAAEAARIVSSLGAQLHVAQQQEADIKSQLTAAQSQAVAAENLRARLDQLQQDANGRRALYQTLLERAQQTQSLPSGASAPDVRVLSPAVPPASPSGPSLKLATLMGGMGGLLFGGLLGMGRVRGAGGFETAGDVTFITGLPVVATLQRRMLARGRGLAETVGSVPGGPEAEVMRAIRGRLRLAGRTGAPRLVLFVPAAEGAAASTMVASLAGSFARVAAADGERVLLIEGNLAPPRGATRLSEILDIARPTAPGGLEEALQVEDWHDVLEADRLPGLDLLLARPAYCPSAPALLRGMHFQNLLVEAREEYDLIVFDAPQAAQADAAALAQRADAVVLMIDAQLGPASARDATTQLGLATRTPLVSVLLSRSRT